MMMIAGHDIDADLARQVRSGSMSLAEAKCEQHRRDDPLRNRTRYAVTAERNWRLPAVWVIGVGIGAVGALAWWFA